MNDHRIPNTDLSDEDAELPRDIRLLLTEIESEPVPQRLLDLAVKLQEVLRERKQSTPQS
jgi:hypothetical protein